MIWSPSTSAPVGVDGQAAVGVAVVRDAQVGAVLADGVAERAEVGGADPVVDVEPVRLGVQRDDLGAGPAVGLGRDGGRRAVRAVDDDPQPGERGPGWPRAGARRSGSTASGRSRTRPMPAPVGRGAGVVQAGLDRLLERVGELVPAGGEELDAVVRHGVVRGGDHHAEVGAERRDEERDRRGGQHADAAPRRRRPRRGRRRRRPRASRRWPAGRARPRATGRCDRSRSASTRAADADEPRRRAPGSGARRWPGRGRRRCRTDVAAPRRSALAVLGSLAGLLEAVLLALDDPRVTGQEAGLLQRRAVLGVGLDQRAGDGQAQRAGLAGGAAAVQVGEDVEALGLLDGDQRLADQLLVQLVREVLLEGAGR